MSRPFAAPSVFRAIADPTRRAMLDLLRKADRRPLDLISHFKMSKPAISQHLRVLRATGLVTQRRQGRTRMYHLRADRLRSVGVWIRAYEPFWACQATTTHQADSDE